MAVTTTKTNKPLNPRGNDQSPKGYNRAELYTGKALDFDGTNDILTMPTALTSSLSTTTITHVLNFKTDFSSFASTRDDVFTYAERGVIFSFNNGTIYIYYRHNLSSWGNFKIPVDKVKLQEWNHCVIVIDYDNDFGAAYINGQEVVNQSGLTGASIDYNSNALTIGAQAGNRFFDGQIAGFKIFNTALTAAQVADLYNNPEKIVPTGVADSALKLWLPMQEGAGTTAYDGSGNGNHGTISGATWAHGIGSPVAQTAVIDWNKGTNLATFSEDFSDSDWIALTSTKVSTSETDPIGGSTAVNISWSNGGAAYLYQGIAQTGAHTVSMYVKSNGGGNDFRLFGDGVGQTSSNFTATNEWQRFDYSFTASGGSSWGIRGVSGQAADLLVAFAQLEATDSVGPYIPNHTGTSITSEVLLPQGLTTGRDITGVNLFENVRKQGALNLDGNSWAEVHDNSSLDITGEVTLEAWARVKYVNQGSSVNAIMTLGGNMTASDSASLGVTSTPVSLFYYRTGGQTGTTLTEGDWIHIVGVYVGANAKLYVNATEVSSNARTSGSLVNSAVKMIGRDSGTQRHYNDQIAQPRIYNRALSAEEVERNYDAGKNIYK